MDDEPIYKPEETIHEALRAGFVTGSGGLVVAAVRNSLTRQNVGALGIFTIYGGTIGYFTSLGFTYAFVKTASANLREKQDPYNAALGGFCAGCQRGFYMRSMPTGIGQGVLTAVLMAAATYTGNSLISYKGVREEEDRFRDKTEIRNRFRRPVNELINEVGEGRGIYGPGYEQRRRQRIKENYGIDVPEPYYKQS